LCNFEIEENVSDLFISNDKFCFLDDNNNNCYEIPSISFIGTKKEQVKFKYTFGESSQNKNAILGPYFYFTNFMNSFTCENIGLQQMNKTNNVNDCIVRVALFTGKVKYIENNISDPSDESEIKNCLLKDETIDQHHERLTIRISDHDGLWSRDFNSVYLGHIELDNGMHLENTPIIVVKEYEQQCPLSYHYVNKKMIEGEFSIL
jgi:hypothetical protein